MHAAVEAVLRQTSSLIDEFERRRRIRAWLPAGRAALGRGDHALAKDIALVLSRDVGEAASTSAGYFERGASTNLDPFSAMFGMPVPTMPGLHVQPEVVAQFQSLIEEARPRQRPRTQRSTRRRATPTGGPAVSSTDAGSGPAASNPGPAG